MTITYEENAAAAAVAFFYEGVISGRISISNSELYSNVKRKEENYADSNP